MHRDHAQPWDGPRVGYVLKMYPRFSETFILTEILAHEARGVPLEIISLRRPLDGNFHAELADVRAPVTYLVDRRVKAGDLWDRLAHAVDDLHLDAHLDELWREDVGDVVQALEVARFARDRGLDHLHAHFGSVATTVTRLAARLAGITYSFTAHAKDIFHESVDPDDLRRKLADGSAVVTISQHNLDHLRDRFGPVSDRVHLVRNGLALDRFPWQPAGEAARGERPLVAGVGRLVEKKGFADLVAACRILADRGIDFECRIMGDGMLAESLQAEVERLGLGDRVHLVGPGTQDEVRTLLREAHVFAAPCVVADDANRDGLPTVLLEAMALGTPCVATPVTGIPEAVEHGATGLLVPPRSPYDLADALERVLHDPDLAGGLAARARTRVEEEFDAAVQAPRMWNVITTHLRDRGIVQATHHEPSRAVEAVSA